MFQTVNSAAPQVQNAALRRAGSVCRNANATDSSVTSCAPISRVPSTGLAPDLPTRRRW